MADLASPARGKRVGKLALPKRTQQSEFVRFGIHFVQRVKLDVPKRIQHSDVVRFGFLFG